ncbi:MAG: hypothetical protein ACLRFE_01225, partial [Clostridia bacterium]
MKKNNIVKLINCKEEYKNKNLYEGIHGLVLSAKKDKVEVLFLNDNNIGEYIVAIADKEDLIIEKEQLPQNILDDLDELMGNTISKEKKALSKNKFKKDDWVELIVEKDKYTKDGVHIGAQGPVLFDYMIKNEVLVDFTFVDEDGEVYGDCIAVHIDDIKLC